MLEITVNGQTRNIEVGASVSALLGAMGLDSRQVAVERNREIVPRALHATTVLEADDQLEVVTFVGGG